MDPARYREQVRAWLRDNAPRVPKASTRDEQLQIAQKFQAALYDAGYAGITWPLDTGGQGLNPIYQTIFSEEAAAYELPVQPFSIGMGMCGPTLVDLGTPAQRQRYVRKLLRGEEVWCQLYSEPGAGSDVASLQTRAVADGDGWVVNGHKVWTSVAHWADFGALLARTDPDLPKHAGLTMFIVDMHDPGIRVRPLIDMTGRSGFNEVFFDNVRIPADAVLGEFNGGWAAAVTMLGHERVSIGAARPSQRSPVAFEALLELGRRERITGDSVQRQRLADYYAHERALELFNTRLSQESAAGRAPGARGSIAKLAGALQYRRAVELASELAGAHAAAWTPGEETGEQVSLVINSAPAMGIAGGTNEIQHNIIGERILGLPKEPQADRDVPFRELRVGTQRNHTPDKEGHR